MGRLRDSIERTRGGAAARIGTSPSRTGGQRSASREGGGGAGDRRSLRDLVETRAGADSVGDGAIAFVEVDALEPTSCVMMLGYLDHNL
jgi:hypothetical protein